jgi:hypothetical protein
MQYSDNLASKAVYNHQCDLVLSNYSNYKHAHIDAGTNKSTAQHTDAQPSVMRLCITVMQPYRCVSLHCAAVAVLHRTAAVITAAV